MLKYSRCEVVGVHPLFGLDISPDEEAKIAVCPARGNIGAEWLKKLFTDAGMVVATLSAEKHDQLMGLVQGANHFSTLALALLIKKSGFTLKEIQSCSTQTFMKRLRRIIAMLGQSDELFGALLMENNFSSGFIDQYMEMVNDLSDIIKDKNGEKFRQFFMELKDFFLV
jgi:prephenate dehydrogenase